MPGRGLSPFGERNFRLLLAATAATMLGTAVAMVAIPFAILGGGYGGNALGVVLAVRGIPFIALLLVGGVVADRLPRQRVLVAATVTHALVEAVFALLVLSGTHRLWALVTLTAVAGLTDAFYYPAAEGLVSQTVPTAALQRANTWLRTGRNGVLMCGGAASGILVAAVGPGWALALEALSYLVAAALRTRMRLPATVRPRGPTFLRQLTEGWQEFASRRWLWSIMVQLSVVSACYTSSLNVLGPVVASEHLDGAKDWGLVLACLTGGFLVGAVAQLWVRPHRPLLAATVSVFPLSVLLWVLALSPVLPVLCCAAVVAGTGLEVFSVNWSTVLQQEIPEDRISRVISYDVFGTLALGPVALALVSPVSSVLGVATTLWLAAAFIAAVTTAVSFVPEIRQIRRYTVHTRLPQPADGTVYPAPS